MRPLHEHYRATRTVFSVDLPGYGFSDRSDRDYTPRLMTDAVHAVAAQMRARCGQLVSPTGFRRLRPWRGDPGSTRVKPWLYWALRGPGGHWGAAVFRALTPPSVIRYFLGRTWDRADRRVALGL